jgi:hypothetical protein
MTRIHRFATSGALIVCLVGTQWSGTLFARGLDSSSSAAPVSAPVVDSTSETGGPAPAGAAAAVATGDQPASTTEPQGSIVERSRFTLSNEALAASAPFGAASAQVWPGTLTFAPLESSSFAQRGYRGRGRGGRNAAAQTAIFLGAVASITGAAVLVYANRPECRTTQLANGCGYGTRVVGGAVLSAGLVGLLVGALTWR